MHINISTFSGSIPPLSPIFSDFQLSPIPDEGLRKYSYNNEDLCSFRLDEHQGENYMLENILPSQTIEPHFEANLEAYDEKQQESGCSTPAKQLVQGDVQFPSEKQAAKVEIEREVPIQNCPQKIPIQESLNSSEDFISSENLIQYLIENINQEESTLINRGLEIVKMKKQYRTIIPCLIKKFKKSKKTKEEMTKYCMRKAFKFIADKMKKNRTHNRDIDSCMRQYFSKSQHASQGFTIPFKKNSFEKTMNGSFLKRVFSSKNFVQDYREFMEEFEDLMIEDNLKKVKYLADLVDDLVRAEELQKIESIKRLPWTKEILDQTLQLGQTFISYAETQTV